MKHAKHIKRGFKRFGKNKGFLSVLYDQSKFLSSTKNIIGIAQRNMVGNGDGTVSFKRPHSYSPSKEFSGGIKNIEDRIGIEPYINKQKVIERVFNKSILKEYDNMDRIASKL